MIGHKTSLNNFKKIEIISSIFPDNNGLKLEINIKEKSQKHSNTWRLNDMLLNNELVNNKIKKEIQKYVEINVTETKKIQEINEWFFEMINKIDEHLTRLIRRKVRGLKLIKSEMKEEK